jgi:hypothetical protein
MEWLLVVGLLLVFGFGCYIMKRIDKFLNQIDKSSKENKIVTSDKSLALVYGNSDLSAKLVQIMTNQGIDFIHIMEENQLYHIDYFSHLFAISESDIDNLMICVVADRIMEVYEKIAICNCIEDQNIFHQNHIHYLGGDGITAQSLFHAMFP